MMTIGGAFSVMKVISNPVLISMNSVFFIRRGSDIDGNLHLPERVGSAAIRPMQRESLTRVSCHCDTNQVAAAKDAIGRIELDPPCTWQVGLHPRMGRTAADVVCLSFAGDE